MPIAALVSEGFVGVGYRPADNRFRVTIDHGGKEYLTLQRWNVRDVADRLLVRRGRGKNSVDEIRDRADGRVLAGQTVPKEPGLARMLQAQLPRAPAKS